MNRPILNRSDKISYIFLNFFKWKEFLAKKPIAGVNSPEDELALNIAKETIGNYKLKTADDYRIPKEERVTTVIKYKELLLTRVKVRFKKIAD